MSHHSYSSKSKTPQIHWKPYNGGFFFVIANGAQQFKISSCPLLTNLLQKQLYPVFLSAIISTKMKILKKYLKTIKYMKLYFRKTIFLKGKLLIFQMILGPQFSQEWQSVDK